MAFPSAASPEIRQTAVEKIYARAKLLILRRFTRWQDSGSSKRRLTDRFGRI
jgi:hypothetical protein